jgi:hypothetical protein
VLYNLWAGAATAGLKINSKKTKELWINTKVRKYKCK